jgi:hypothetical protein
VSSECTISSAPETLSCMSSTVFLDILWRAQCVFALLLSTVFRYAGLRLVVLDETVSWMGLKTHRIVGCLLLHGICACRLRDLMWLFPCHADDTSAAHDSDPPLSAVYAACVECECLPWELTSRGSVDAILGNYTRLHLRYLETLCRVDRLCRIAGFAYAQGYAVSAYACRSYGISHARRVVALENTSNKNLFVWDDVSGITVNANLARNIFQRYADLVNPAETERMCNAHLSALTEMKSADHLAGTATLSCDTPYVLILGQVLTDSSLVFGTTAGWGPLDVIQATLKACQALGHTVVVKLHPKESNGLTPITDMPYNRLTYRRLQAELPFLQRDRVVIDDDNRYDTYALIQQAAVVVTINSQAGLEAALLEKPVVVCGRSFYAGIGFTFDCNDADSLLDALRRAVAMTPQEQASRTKLAKRFGAIYLSKYCATKSARTIARTIASRPWDTTQ